MTESIKETNMAGKISTGSIDMGNQTRKIPAKTGQTLINATPEIVKEVLKELKIPLNKIARNKKEASQLVDVFSKIALGIYNKDSNQKLC